MEKIRYIIAVIVFLAPGHFSLPRGGFSTRFLRQRRNRARAEPIITQRRQEKKRKRAITWSLNNNNNVNADDSDTR